MLKVNAISREEIKKIPNFSGFLIIAFDDNSPLEYVHCTQDGNDLTEFKNYILSKHEQGRTIKFFSKSSESADQMLSECQRFIKNWHSLESNEESEVYIYGNGRIRYLKPKNQIRSGSLNSIHAKPRTIKVIVVEDSKVMLKMLVNRINSFANCEVVAALPHGDDIEKVVSETNADVMTLDLNLPGRNGAEILRDLIPKKYIPTVILSALNVKTSDLVINALENGALDYLQKPTLENLDAVSAALEEKINLSAKYGERLKNREKTGKLLSSTFSQNSSFTPETINNSIIAIGSSTGGIQALNEIFERLPKSHPPIIVSQHILKGFSHTLAQRLAQTYHLNVKEAQNAETIEPNAIYIAPGGHHLIVRPASPGKHIIKIISNEEKFCRFAPNIDLMFDSLMNAKYKSICAIILTGLGSDGSVGMGKLKAAGNITLVQSPDSCIAPGMPSSAVKANAHLEELPLTEIINKSAVHLARALARKEIA